jgi:hypothetical protein
MPSAYATIVVPTGTADGTGVDTDSLQGSRTIILGGLTEGAGEVVHIEASDDNTNWSPVVDFDANGVKIVDCASGFMRARSSSVSVAPSCSVAAEQTSILDVQMNMPVGNGTGSNENFNILGAAKTIKVMGDFEASVSLEISHDGTNFETIANFTSPGSIDINFVASVGRVRVTGYQSGAPEVSVAAAPLQSLSPEAVIAVTAQGFGFVNVVRTVFTAGAAGSADDVAILTGLPWSGAVVLDTILYVSTAVSGSTCTFRSAVGGLGIAYSDALNTAATGVKRSTALTSTPTVAGNGNIFLRRSDRGVAGTAVVYLLRTA